MENPVVPATANPRRRGRAEGNYFFSAFSSTVPPLALQSFSDMSFQPLPLQPFWPLQALSAPLHAPLPLQALAPWQWTLPPALAEATIGAADVKRPTTAAATSAPLVVMLCLLVSCRNAGGRSFTLGLPADERSIA